MSNYNYYGFETLGKHTSDFGLQCIERSIGFPEKNKILVQPPFSNTILDFSNLYGSSTYSGREYTFKFLVDRTISRADMYRLWTRVINWLTQPNKKVPLYDDLMHDYYYLAELVKAPSFDEAIGEDGSLTLTFDCYPFRICELEEGHDIWDIFDFDLDVAQVTKYDVTVTRDIVLLNAGSGIAVPTIRTNNDMVIKFENQTFSVPPGTSESSRFRLKSGLNELKILGTGTIEFIWHKELI